MIRVKASKRGVRVPVQVVPGASRDRVYGEHDGRLKLSVAAPPEDGRANRAVRSLLASELGVKDSQVSIVSGEHSRAKEVFIERVSTDALEAIIG
ncbi:MAG: DUF167 domain-containing protein [Planctomycetota bacterium]